jgi:hypothetical protein
LCLSIWVGDGEISLPSLSPLPSFLLSILTQLATGLIGWS